MAKGREKAEAKRKQSGKPDAEQSQASKTRGQSCAVLRVRMYPGESESKSGGASRSRGFEGKASGRRESAGSCRAKKPEDANPADIHNRIQFPVTIAGGPHLFPSRTQKLSLHTLMVLGWQRPGRVGSRRIQLRRREIFSFSLFGGNHRAIQQARVVSAGCPFAG